MTPKGFMPLLERAEDIVGWVDAILQKAVDAHASDIHFEPTAREMCVKWRLDGVLTRVEQAPKALAENVVARLKVMAGLLTYRNDIPQEGRLAFHTREADVIYDKRLAVFPTIHGQRAVVRIFYEDQKWISLTQLGLPTELAQQLQDLVQRNQGVLLLTGPAGSGKSTTLATLIQNILNRFPGRSVITLEDPVERHLEGATQIQINPHSELTFPTALRSLMRQDPEVLMIGEIRDADTAKMAIEAGLTGHLVMSTMHGGSPIATLWRLLEMGIEPYQVTSSISAIVNQRLVRRLCASCKQIEAETGESTSMGCASCFHTGYTGRLLLAEMLPMSRVLRQGVLAHHDLQDLEHQLVQQGHQTILDHGLQLVQQGETSRSELQRVCGTISSVPSR